MPNATDTGAENLARYNAYLARALFLEATKNTQQGLIGAAFRINPMFAAKGLEFMTKDADGAGNSIYQQAQMVLRELLTQGRCGLLADYPTTMQDTSVQAQQTGGIRPTIALYSAASIINWRHTRVGGECRLSLLVLSEVVQDVSPSDEFSVTDVQQYRVLRLTDGVYTVEVWRDDQIIEGPFTPRQSTGAMFDFIPFTFVGSINNDAAVDPIPLEPLARVNLAHYRNSADYEDSAYRVGQAQAWISGLSDEWRNWLQDNGVKIGGPTAILLPQGGQFGFAQVNPNMIAKEAMDDKLKLMIQLGARMIESGSAAKTATQSNSEQSAQHSVLSLCVANLNEAYLRVLSWCGLFVGAVGNIEFAVTQDFADLSIDPQVLAELLKQNQAGLLPRPNVWAYMRKVGLIEPEQTDSDLIGLIDAEGPTNGLNANVGTTTV
ncbi:MAG: DUF4055 domain-containing protein [Flavobacteriales bacterium]